MKLYIKSNLAITFLLLALVLKSSFAISPGGSNYGWFNLSNCEREPYGVISNYHSHKETIDQQLKNMYDNGQRRLRIPVFHGRNLDTGTVVPSNFGRLPAVYEENLKNLLHSIKTTGYSEIVVGFFPTGINFPANWQEFNEEIYQENWNFIFHTRKIVHESGLQYRIDLMNEGAPAPEQPALLAYTQRLWLDYTHVFGKSDTVGFSIIGSDINRLQEVAKIYQGNPPYLYDLHFYENAYNNFIMAASILKGQGWIIGETYYNDPIEADEISRAIRATGKTVFFTTQWPLSRNNRCSDVDVNFPASNFEYQRIQ